MSFSKFTDVRAKRSLFISITKSQSFGFGGDFLQKYRLQSYNYVSLFYDSVTKRIGFQFSNEKESDSSYKLVSNPTTDSKGIVARAFYNKNLEEINIKDYQTRYIPEEVHDPEFGRLYVIRLKRKDYDNYEDKHDSTPF